MQMRPRGQKTSLPRCILPALKCPGSILSFIFHAKGNTELAAPRNPGEDNQDDKWNPPPSTLEWLTGVGEGLKCLNKPGEPAFG